MNYSNRVLSVGQGKEKQAIPSNSIMYLTGESNYSNIILSGAPTVLTSKCLAYLEQKLPNFIRIHKQCLINPHFVRKLEIGQRDSAYIRMRNGKRLKISRRKVQGLKAQFTATAFSN